jgi:hypothetical protein
VALGGGSGVVFMRRAVAVGAGPSSRPCGRRGGDERVVVAWFALRRRLCKILGDLLPVRFDLALLGQICGRVSGGPLGTRENPWAAVTMMLPAPWASVSFLKAMLRSTSPPTSPLPG